MNKAQFKQLEADLWTAADNLRQGSDLKSSQYSNPVLGIIFLRFADNIYRRHEAATRTRDSLLPRLISGKLRVDDLAIAFPPSMAAEAAS